MGKIIKRIWEWVSHGDTVWGVLNMIFPALGGVGGYIISWINSVHPLIWYFSVLGGIALGLLISNQFISRSLSRKMRISKHQEDLTEKQINANEPITLTDFEFRNTRPSFDWYRSRVSSARKVWVLWNVGGIADEYGALKLNKIERMLLVKPTNKHTESIMPWLADVLPHTLKSLNDRVSSVALNAIDQDAPTGSKIQVKWWKGWVGNVITLGNPESPDAWAMLETYIQWGEATDRPMYYFTKQQYPDLYERFEEAYLRMWNSKELSEAVIKKELSTEPEINIEIDNCSWGNTVIRDNQPIETVEIALTLNVRNPPINVTELQLYMGEVIANFVGASPTIPFTQESERGCCIAKYEVSVATIYEVPKSKRDKYHLCVLAAGQKWVSKEFTITIPSHLLAGDKGGSQT
ncbi:hypothetical protein ACFLV0_05040 [Chloroflexota bacterium]